MLTSLMMSAGEWEDMGHRYSSICMQGSCLNLSVMWQLPSSRPGRVLNQCTGSKGR